MSKLVTKNSFLAKVKSKSKPAKKVDLAKVRKAVERAPRLLFTMDATGSRSHTWELAQEITLSMFDVMPGELEIALGYHGGGKLKEITPFKTSKEYFKEKVSGVYCDSGWTDLCSILRAATEIKELNALIYIGDAFEESEETAYEIARILAEKKTPCFMFIEGENRAATEVFRKIAKITGGALFPFENNSPKDVSDKLAAIAAFAGGGKQLLSKMAKQLPSAKLLLEELK